MWTAGRRIASLVLVASGVAAAVVGEGGPSRPLAPPAHVSTAPDEAGAVLAARRQGTRVEVTSARTGTRTVFANPDGTNTAEIAAVPTRVQRGTTWVALDTTIVPRPDGSVGPRTVADDVALSNGGLSAPLIRLRSGPAELSLGWPGVLPKPVLAGNSATYHEVLQGVDLVVRAEPSGYRQLLVIKSRQAAQNPALARIGLPVETRGLTLSADASGALQAVDAAGKRIFGSPPSSMWDATERAAPVGVTVAGGVLNLLPDKGFLDDDRTVYPVTVDPRWDSVLINDHNPWANVLSGNPDTSYWRQSADGTHPEWAQVGQCNNSRGDCNGIGEGWAYFQFDTAFFAGRDVFEVKFYSTVAHSGGCAASEHELWVIAGGINGNLTWRNRPTGFGVAGFSTPAACDAGHGLEVNVQPAINGGGLTTYYLKAKNGTDQGAWRKYVAADTKISVRWNRTPTNPTNLRTDPQLPAPCRWCAGKPYIGDQNIRLIATVSDPDNDVVRPMWRVQVQGRPLDARDGEWVNSGLSPSINVPLGDKDGLQVDWWVHSADEYIGSGATTGPSFVVDTVGVPTAPTVESRLYPENDNGWHGGAGVADVFTFGANGVGDIDHYLWGFQYPPDNPVDATALGGVAYQAVAPPAGGSTTLHVVSVDRAGHLSPDRVYRFNTRTETGPRAQWSFEGNTTDTAIFGERNGTLHGSPTYTAGAVGTALLFDGQSTSDMTASTPVRTDGSYSYAVWVRLDELPQRPMAVLCQEDPKYCAPALMYRNDPGDPKGPKWTVWVPGGDRANPALTGIDAPQPPQLGRWTHLAVVYDRPANELRLYVDGVASKVAMPNGNPPWAWNTAGPLAIGRLLWDGSKMAWWHGAIDEVQTYDRALSDVEVRAIVSRDDVRTGHWRFDDQTARNSVPGGSDGVLKNGASFVDNGNLGRAVKLDGTDDHVLTGGPAVRTDQSFTVAAWVKADSFSTNRSALTAVSQDGGKEGGFHLQYRTDVKKWVFMKLSADIPAGPDLKPYFAVAGQTPVAGDWVHLTGVYDASTKQLQIYVNGEPGAAQPAVYSGTNWTADGPLVIGRGRYNGLDADYWPGSVDEVRTYSRALAPEEIKAIVSQSNVRAGAWKLDGNASDSSGRGLNGTWTGTPAWTAGQSTDPDPADQALLLNGSNSVSTANALNLNESFAVAAWVRADALTGDHTVLSQDAVNSAGFSLSATSDGHWSLFATEIDSTPAAPTGARAFGGTPQVGVWTHVAGVYNKQRKQIELYVNGALVTVAPHTVAVPSTGALRIGNRKWLGSFTKNFAGAIDDVQVYSRALYAEEIRAMAGRDLSLVHNWKLNDATVDTIGARPGTLTGGAAYGPGRAGTSVRLDGTDDAVTTTGVDLRTDQSFTVSAWVDLTRPGTCADVCMRDAVSLAGGATGPSKFRLGHRMDQDQAPGPGKWIFELPERDGTVTKAAISAEWSQFDSWVHLVGTYNSVTGLIELYVYTDDPLAEPDYATGRLATPWQATGGLQIGRAVEGGAAAQFWPGSVDDVRLYTGNLSADRIKTMHDSYPAVTS